MKDITHLPPDEQKHFMICEQCIEFFDCRDLQQVFYHTHLHGLPKAEFSSSINLDEPNVEYLKGKEKIDLN